MPTSNRADHKTVRVIAPVFIALVLAGIIGCGPPKPVEEITTAPCYPLDLKVDEGDRSLSLSWKIDCERNIAGYDIYVSQEPLVEEYPGNELPKSIKPFNDRTFPGDTDPSDGIEHYDAGNLKNGVTYFVSVRIVLPDRSVTRPSNEVRVVCGPSGEIQLDFRYRGTKDGFAFEQNDYVAADALGNDLYFYSKEGVDYLASPHRLDGFLRSTTFRVLPFTGDLAGVRAQLRTLSVEPSDERVSVKKGDWVQILTADNLTALVQIRGFEGAGEDRKVTLFFAYRPSPNWL